MAIRLSGVQAGLLSNNSHLRPVAQVLNPRTIATACLSRSQGFAMARGLHKEVVGVVQIEWANQGPH